MIVGGGLVGSLLANALLSIPVRVVLVEARDVDTLEQPSFDARSTALANGTVRIFERLGLWQDVAPAAEPIEHIHIGQQGRFGAARIHAADEGVAALGYTAENRILGSALWAPLRRAGMFECLSPARCTGFEVGNDRVTAVVEQSDTQRAVRARLLVAADGARSSVRQAMGIGASAARYDQCAVIVNCVTERPHAGWAFERFTPQGPLALLPLSERRSAVIWSLEQARASEILELADADFVAALQRAFGFRLGRIERAGARSSHPLFRVRSDAVTGARSALLGNAAVSMHPVAGQSFNLAVRDVASLAELIAGADDPGSPELLQEYRRWRHSDQQKVSLFTHGLVSAMGIDLPGFRAMRDIGLVAFDLLPGAKRALARHTMGLAGRVPRLARGLPLR